MRRRIPVPDSLSVAFTNSDAVAAGITLDQLRRPELQHPFRGVRTRPLSPADGEAPADTWRRAILHRAAALRLVMPSSHFFSHITAAIIWGLPVPVSADPEDLTLDVGTFHPHRTPRGGSVRGHQLQPGLGHTTRHGGFAVTTPATTWATLGAQLSVHDLVALGDAIARIPRVPGGYRAPAAPLGTIDQLRSAVSAGRRNGVGALRVALPLVRCGSSSHPESIVRLLLVEAGLPEPQLDVDVFDDSGTLLGCSEMAYPQYRVAIEYEGDHHRVERAQWNRDIDKYHAYAENGWTVVRLTSAIVFGRPGETACRVGSALLRAGWPGHVERFNGPQPG